MRESIHKFFQVGTIQWMSYPDRDVVEGVRAIARDDFFDAIEISQIADDGKREEVKRLLEQSHLRVCYGAQPRLLGTGLNPNDTDYYYYALGTDGLHHFSTTLAEHNAFVNSSEYGG